MTLIVLYVCLYILAGVTCYESLAVIHEMNDGKVGGVTEMLTCVICWPFIFVWAVLLACVACLNYVACRIADVTRKIIE